MSGGGDLPESWEGTAVPLVAVETALDETPEEGGFQVPFLVVCVEGVRMPAWQNAIPGCLGAQWLVGCTHPEPSALCLRKVDYLVALGLPKKQSCSFTLS